MPPTEPHGSTRSTPKILLAVAGALLVARVALGVIDATHPEKRPEIVEWAAPSGAADEARATGRLVLYAFTDSRVAASRRLSSELFATPEAAQQIGSRFVPVHVDGGPAKDTPVTAALRARFGVKHEPALVLANPDGSKFKVVEGFDTPMATMQSLAEAQMEVMDIPFNRMGRAAGGRSFRFQFGGHGNRAADSLLNAPTGEADSVAQIR